VFFGIASPFRLRFARWRDIRGTHVITALHAQGFVGSTSEQNHTGVIGA
jgi:hypothetical protein